MFTNDAEFHIALNNFVHVLGSAEPYCDRVQSSAEIKLFFELTGEFELVSEPIVFVSMSSIRNWYQI